MLLLLTIFFILLQPGLIITASGISKNGFLGTEETSVLDILIHSVVFFALMKMIINNTFGLGFLNEIEKQIIGS